MAATFFQQRSLIILPIFGLAAVLLTLYSLSNWASPLIIFKYFSRPENLNRPIAKMKQNCKIMLRTLLFGNSSFSQFHADRLDKRKFKFDNDLKLFRYDNQLIFWTYRKMPNKRLF